MGRRPLETRRRKKSRLSLPPLSLARSCLPRATATPPLPRARRRAGPHFQGLGLGQVPAPHLPKKPARVAARAAAAAAAALFKARFSLSRRLLLSVLLLLLLLWAIFGAEWWPKCHSSAATEAAAQSGAAPPSSSSSLHVPVSEAAAGSATGVAPSSVTRPGPPGRRSIGLLSRPAFLADGGLG